MTVTGLLMALGVLVKYPSTDLVTNLRQFALLQSYSDIPSIYVERGFSLPFTWFGGQDSRYPPIEYPALSAVYMEVCAWVTHLLHGVDATQLAQRQALSVEQIAALPDVAKEARTFFLVSAAGLWAAGMAAMRILLSVVRNKRPLLLLVIASPALILTAFLNWDLLPVLCVTAALAAHHRGRHGWVGAWIGIGTAVKLYPALFIVPAVALAIRDRAWSRAAVLSGTSLGAWFVCNAPSLLLHPQTWLEFWSFNRERPAQYGSLWYAIRILGHGQSLTTINVVSGAVLVVAAMAVLVLALRCRRAPSIESLSLLLLTAFLITNKVFSPQYVWWYVPVLVLAIRALPVMVVWSLGQLFHEVETWFFIAGMTTPAVGIDKVYVASVGMRLAVEALALVPALAGLRPHGPGRLPVNKPAAGPPNG